MFEWRKLIWQFLAGTGTKHRRINATSAKTSQKFTARGHGNGESLVMRLISSQHSHHQDQKSLLQSVEVGDPDDTGDSGSRWRGGRVRF